MGNACPEPGLISIPHSVIILYSGILISLVGMRHTEQQPVLPCIFGVMTGYVFVTVNLHLQHLGSARGAVRGVQAAARHGVVLPYNRDIFVVFVVRVMIVSALVTGRKKVKCFTPVSLHLLIDIAECVIRIILLSGHRPDTVRRFSPRTGYAFHEASHAAQEAPALVCKGLVHIDGEQRAEVIMPDGDNRITLHQGTGKISCPDLHYRLLKKTSAVGQRLGSREPSVSIIGERKVFLVP